jgi:hypothetical protein
MPLNAGLVFKNLYVHVICNESGFERTLGAGDEAYLNLDFI